MLSRVEINKSNANDETFRNLYEKSFPPEEKVPFEELVQMFDLLNTDFSAFYDGKTFIGIVLAFRFEKHNFLLYFAVVDELRGKGYGTKILHDFLEKYKNDNPVVLGIESPDQEDAPNLEIRKRRKAFYERNGMRDTKIYSTIEGIQYTVMSSSTEPFTTEDKDRVYSTYLGAREKIKISKKEN